MSAPLCSCGRPKDRRAKGCAECYRRRWTPAEQAILLELLVSGETYKCIGERLGRSETAVLWHARLNGWRHDPETTIANRAAGRAAFWSDKARVREWKKKIRKALRTPQSRAIFAEECRQRNLAGTMGVRHHSDETKERIRAAHLGRVMSPETRQKISEARKAYWAAKRDGGQSAYRAAMLADGGRLRRVNDDIDHEEQRIWCAQCERQVTAARATSCDSRFCKAKAVAA